MPKIEKLEEEKYPQLVLKGVSHLNPETHDALVAVFDALSCAFNTYSDRFLRLTLDQSNNHNVILLIEIDCDAAIYELNSSSGNWNQIFHAILELETKLQQGLNLQIQRV